MSEAKVNDPTATVVTFGGVPLGGWGFGDFVTIEEAGEDAWTQQTGADGETIFTKSAPNPVLTVTVNLAESSASNSYLSIFYEEARKKKNGMTAAFFYKDGSGTSVVSGSKAVIAKAPTIVKGKEGKERSWVFLVKQDIRHDGQM